MSGPVGSSQWMYQAGEDYTIDQSLRFENSDTAVLSQTLVTPTNNKIWTLSLWVKRGKFGISTNSASANYNIMSTSGDTICIGDNNGGNDMLFFQVGGSNLKTTPKYRDPSAWYHIVYAVDTTQGTAANRVKIYVNGSQVTVFGTETYPSQNAATTINSAVNHYIGRQGSATVEYYDGYMAEMHFIDGQQLTPSSFGEAGDYGNWKPIEVDSMTYGNNGFYLSFAGGGIISSATGGDSIGTDGDYKYNTFLSGDTFTPSADGYVEYLVVGGGGGGGYGLGGGGGAGGYRTGFLEVTGSTAYTVTVGAGGASSTNGVASSISGSDITTLTSVAGGQGGGTNDPAIGGSGGGGRGIGSGSVIAGAAGTSNQGYAGGNGVGSDGFPAGGGGGAGAVGANGVGSGAAGNGGVGLQSNIDTNNYYYAAGGGGGAHFSPSTTGGNGGTGGAGGGARGGGSAGSGGGTAINSGASGGTGDGGVGGAAGANTGSGGGGGAWGGGDGGAGGSGIVILRYKFQ
jgi:hypothetical protein